MKDKDRCPNARNKCAECPTTCDLHGHTCELELGGNCKIWDEIRKDWEEEDKVVSCP